MWAKLDKAGLYPEAVDAAVQQAGAARPDPTIVVSNKAGPYPEAVDTAVLKAGAAQPDPTIVVSRGIQVQ
eukprot:gene29274-12516_t